jgi:hypothetical protein
MNETNQSEEFVNKFPTGKVRMKAKEKHNLLILFSGTRLRE